MIVLSCKVSASGANSGGITQERGFRTSRAFALSPYAGGSIWKSPADFTDHNSPRNTRSSYVPFDLNSIVPRIPLYPLLLILKLQDPVRAEDWPDADPSAK